MRFSADRWRAEQGRLQLGWVMGRRILIKGTCGSGKSTLGLELARRLGLPYVELDALHWRGPNWVAASASELRAALVARLDDERGWVVDGNYDSKLGTSVLDRAELIVWLDLPLKLKLLRLVRRTSRRWLKREELWNGNRESVRAALWGREALFMWALRTHFRQRREWPALFSGRPLLRLRRAQEVAVWLAEFCSAPGQVPVSSRLGEGARP